MIDVGGYKYSANPFHNHSLASQKPISDRFSDNGVEKRLHYVIKNNDFVISVALPEGTEESFNELLLEAQLLYDCSPVPKDVLQVRQKPFKYKGTVERNDSRKCSLLVSISILSSQHEDMNFVIFIIAKDSKSGKVVANGYSDPIQVISKPDVLRKKREPKAKKRTWNDRITEMLERIEANQQKHQDAIKLVYDQQKEIQVAPKPVSIFSSIPTATPTPSPIEKTSQQKPENKLERAFQDLLAAYKEIATEERPTKIKKLVATTSVGDESCLQDLVSTMQLSFVPTQLTPKSVSSLLTDDLDLNNLINELFAPGEDLSVF